ncbi:hypothetical protein BGX23_003547, partial [Mortierella sp. AD031]
INEPPLPKERMTEPRVAAVKVIPSEALALEACSMLRTAQEATTTRNAWGIRVTGVGDFTSGASKLLLAAT